MLKVVQQKFSFPKNRKGMMALFHGSIYTEKTFKRRTGRLAETKTGRKKRCICTF